MTPRFQCLPRPALPPWAPSAGLLTVSDAPAGGGIARVPRLAVVRAPLVPVASAATAPAGGHTILRDILSGLVDELSGEAAAAAKGADPVPVAAAEEHPPTGLPPRRSPWRRPFFPRTGVACFPLHDPLPVT